MKNIIKRKEREREEEEEREREREMSKTLGRNDLNREGKKDGL